MLASKGAPVALIPKYSMMGPFRGHMSNKSSPFFPGSSCKLSTQYIIQDHMATHYRKLFSAKAAVDSSPPKSLCSSIKYKDQQKKENLRKAVKNFKKEIQWAQSALALNFGSLSPELGTWPLVDKNNVQLSHIGGDSPITLKEQSLGLPVQKTPSRTPSPVLIARQTACDIIQHALSPSYLDSTPSTALPTTSLNFQPVPRGNGRSMKKKFQDPQTKTYSGDLLVQHSGWFSSPKQPFTPRILKKPAKSALSKYRYYTSPKKKNPSCQSSPGLDDMYDPRLTEMYSSSEGKFSKAYQHTWNPRKDESKLLFTKHQTSESRRAKLLTMEEELKYLQFLQDVTNDILLGSYSSSKALDGIFKAHMESRRHELDEAKMKKMFRELMDELNSSKKLAFSISYAGIQQSDTDSFLAF
ncbi:spermatogenesis-associated protein 7-like [Rhinatrema bivittatum]|uniref:spermatogenesis-associated protein 7-like n=1 Tax=Rhinatrema bivittatum TaxID=194408 RepID=UPI00112E3293|nr:spermatogenesis-associated protein 7-like [Rhinatrema bivittatum]